MVYLSDEAFLYILASCLIYSWAFCHTPRICNQSDLCSFILTFLRLIEVVFSKDTMLLVSDKCDSINKPLKKVNELIKLHILRRGKMLMNLLGNWLIRLHVTY